MRKSKDELKKKEQPELLWHYTSIDTPVKICTNLNIRATHHAFLNDSKEVKNGADILLECIRENAPLKENLQLFEDVKNKIEKNMNEYSLYSYYIISFSKTRDYLPQWRAYTSKAGGCAIGFDPTVLKSCMRNVAIKDDYCLYFADCHYFDSKKSACEVLAAVQGAPMGGFSAKIPSEDRPRIFNDWCKNEMIKWCCSSKSSYFKEENEFRCIFSLGENAQSGEKKRDVIHFENRKPFIEIPIEENVFPELIREVYISPHGDIERNFQFVQFLSRVFGKTYGTKKSDGLLFSVIPSKLPYIG